MPRANKGGGGGKAPPDPPVFLLPFALYKLLVSDIVLFFQKGVKRIGLPCGSFTRYGRPPRVLTIKPSTMWFLSTAKTFKEPFA